MKKIILTLVLATFSIFYSCQKEIKSFPLPELGKFPIPLPSPTCYFLFDENKLPEFKKLADVDNFIREELSEAGYWEFTYYPLGKGFAIVTRMENIDSNKKNPLIGVNRWSLEMTRKEISNFEDYQEALLMPNTGNCRFFIFTYTNYLPAFKNEEFIPITKENFRQDIFRQGLNRLPLEISETKVSNEYKFTSLIYEFKKKDKHPIEFINQENSEAYVHLKNSGLFAD